MLVAPRWPAADLRSDIAAEARAKITYERLIKVCDDAGLKDTLNFLMSREVAHQKMFEAALDSLQANFPPGTLSGDEKLNHAYFQDAASYGTEGAIDTAEGFDLVQQQSTWGFELDQNPPPPRRRATRREQAGRKQAGRKQAGREERGGQSQGHPHWPLSQPARRGVTVPCRSRRAGGQSDERAPYAAPGGRDAGLVPPRCGGQTSGHRGRGCPAAGGGSLD